ncbi:oxidoreductase, partial [Pseudomonas sp. FW305-53]
YDDATEAAMARVLESLRRHSDMPIAIQLGHAGRKASTNLPWRGGAQLPVSDHNGWQTVAPSALGFAESDIPPVALDRSGLDRVRAAFA